MLLDRVADGDRDGELGHILGPVPSAVAVIKVPPLDQRPQHFLEEEGVALATVLQGGPERSDGAGEAKRRLDQGARLLGAEASQAELFAEGPRAVRRAGG